MADDNTQVAPTNVKRRSLSSYLSNVTSRKEELAQLKKHSKDNDDIPQTDATTTTVTTATTTTTTITPPVSTPLDTTNTNKPSAETANSPHEPPIQEDSNNTVLHNHNTIKEPVGKLTREDLKSILHDSTDPEDFNKMMDESNNNSNHNTINEQIQEIYHSDIGVTSDTETPKGSPIKIRKGRLIRGDHLENLHDALHSANRNTNTVPEDFSSIPASLLSSPIRMKTDTSPPASQNFTRRTHVATTKANKSKKSIYRDSGGRTKLHIACDKGKLETVKQLLQEQIIDINDRDNGGNTPLHEAALNGHLDIVKLLIRNGANINIQSGEYFKDTPLVDASANGHIDIVEYLLKHGANPTLTNSKGLTAYDAIDEDDDLDDEERLIVRNIKQLVRDATIKWNQKKLDSSGTTDKNLVNDSITTNSSHLNQSMDTTTTNDSSFPTSSTNNNTSNQIEFYWTDLNTKTGKDKLINASKEGQLAYVGQYLENGGQIEFKAFLECVRFGHEDIASLFLAFGAQVNKLSREDYFPLMIAVGRGHLGTVNLLLKAGADPLLKNKRGYNSFFYAQNSILGITDENEINLLKGAVKDRGGEINETELAQMNGSANKYKQTRKDDNVKTEKLIDKSTTNKTAKKVKSKKVQNYKSKDDDITINEELASLFDDDGNNSNSDKGTKPELTKVKASTPKDKVPEKDKGIEKDNNQEIKIIDNTRKETEKDDSLKRSHNDSNESKGKFIESKKIKVEDKINHEETMKERQERLKAEEEYLQKRLENKKRKEQEFLQKLKEEDEKRHEEKKKQELEEIKRQEAITKQKQLEEVERIKKIEIEKRIRIRSQYPIGLKLIKFDNDMAKNFRKFLPLYYITKTINNVSCKFVLDLQIMIILNDVNFLSNVTNVLSPMDKCHVTNVTEKMQIWNILKFIFLNGGHDNPVDSYCTLDNMEEKLEWETQEFNKFSKLPMTWISWDRITVPEKAQLEEQMCPITIERDTATLPMGTTSHHPHYYYSPFHQETQTGDVFPLPLKLQHNENAARLLRMHGELHNRPMW